MLTFPDRDRKFDLCDRRVRLEKRRPRPKPARAFLFTYILGLGSGQHRFLALIPLSPLSPSTTPVNLQRPKRRGERTTSSRSLASLRRVKMRPSPKSSEITALARPGLPLSGHPENGEKTPGSSPPLLNERCRKIRLELDREKVAVTAYWRRLRSSSEDKCPESERERDPSWLEEGERVRANLRSNSLSRMQYSTFPAPNLSICLSRYCTQL